MNFDLHAAARDHVQIVAHRGVSGGNIPCNTLAAFEIALSQGADMLEMDVCRARDGELFIFHGNMEKPHLGIDTRLGAMTGDEIRRLRYLNQDDTPTQFGVATLDEFLETFRGRCFFNVDKFWQAPEDICRALERHGVMEQALVKSAPNQAVFATLESLCPQVMYMPIARAWDGWHEELLRRSLRYTGAELLFFTDDHPLAQPEIVDILHRDGKLCWGNAIIYDHLAQIAAGHSDDTSLTGHPEEGWGWLRRHGFDLIQTDWPAQAIAYLKSQQLYATPL